MIFILIIPIALLLFIIAGIEVGKYLDNKKFK